MSGGEIGALVGAAAGGDACAWGALVDRFHPLVWGTARACGLSPADAMDVSQTTWLRLAEHLHRIREPERLGGWLVITARHESLRTLRCTQRQIPVDPTVRTPELEADREAADPDGRLIEEERGAALWRAFEALPPPCQLLLRTLLADPAPSYAEVSEALGVPVGSIGPKRSRCLQRLRRRTELAAIDGEEEPEQGVTMRRAAR